MKKITTLMCLACLLVAAGIAAAEVTKSQVLEESRACNKNASRLIVIDEDTVHITNPTVHSDYAISGSKRLDLLWDLWTSTSSRTGAAKLWFEKIGKKLDDDEAAECLYSAYNGTSAGAAEYCASKGKRWWDGTQHVVDSHRVQFKCLDALHYVYEHAKSRYEWQAEHREQFCGDWGRRFPNRQHLCREGYAARIYGAVPDNFCSTWDRYISPKDFVSCEEIEKGFRAIEAAVYSQTRTDLKPATPTVNNNLDLNSAKKECAELGFKAGTEKFGECVLQLLR